MGRSRRKPHDAERVTTSVADVVPWHVTSTADVLVQLESRAEGLTTGEARSRLARLGSNALPSVPSRSAVRILIDQFRSVMVLLLIVAATIALATGDLIEVGYASLMCFISEAVRRRRFIRAVRGWSSRRSLAHDQRPEVLRRERSIPRPSPAARRTRSPRRPQMARSVQDARCRSS